MLEPSETLDGSHAKDTEGLWHIVDRSNVTFCTAPPLERTPLEMTDQRHLGDGTPEGEPVCQICRRNRQIMAHYPDQDV
jgi:hypothetical protein